MRRTTQAYDGLGRRKSAVPRTPPTRAARRPAVRPHPRHGLATLDSMVARDDVLKALEQVIDPELRRPVTELDMVRDVRIEGGDVHVTIALTVAGCPLRNSFEEQVQRFVGSLPGVDLDLALLRRDDAGGAAALDGPAARLDDRADEGDLARRLDARDRGRVRQGRRRQVVADGQPRRRARRAGPGGGRARRRRLRPLDPAHARDAPAAGARRPDDDPGGRARPSPDVDRVLPRRQPAGDVARADAAPRARAVPLGRALAAARHAPRRHAAGDGRRLDLARPAAPARRGRRRDDAAAARAGGGGARGA